MALAGEPDPLAVVDPGRDLDVERPLLERRGRRRGTRAHGCSTIRPAPPQRGHGGVRTNSPKKLRETCCTRPAPPHVGHVRRRVPGSAPFPPQCSHVTATPNGDLARRAARRLDQLDLDLGGDVRAARARRRRPAPNRSSPKNAEKRSDEAAEVEVAGLEAAAAQAGVAEAVVELRASRGFDSTS